jgi:transmembrane sensor
MKRNTKNTGNKGNFHPNADKVWYLFDNIPPPSDDLEGRIISNVMGDTSHPHIIEPSIRSYHTWIYRIAAMLFIAAGVAFWALYTPESTDRAISLTESIESSTIIYSATNGERKELNLTDNIYVQLNFESELRILSDRRTPVLSSPVRLVYLKGEAYFNVIDTDEGFEIYTDAGIIGVIGTSFNVLARNNNVEVTVERGIVALRGFPDEDQRDEVQIPSGYMSRKSKNLPALEPLPVDVNKYFSWRIGKLVFEQTPLSDVIQNLERAYNVRIDLRDTNLAEIPVTGEFGQEPLTQILNEICWSANLRFRQEDNIYILYQPD